jgi:hypothetical protein
VEVDYGPLSSASQLRLRNPSRLGLRKALCVPQEHKFYGSRERAAALVREVNAEVAVLDGELAVPDQMGRTVFARL